MSLNKIALLASILFLTASSAQAQVSTGLSFNDDGLQSFYLGIGQAYGVPEREVIIIHERQIPDDEIPVVFFIANRAHVRRADVCALRLSGRSWMDIVLFYHLDPVIFYIELDGDPGPQYGRAYGHWKRPRREWSNIRFEDADIVNMVNLRFVSKHYKMRPDEVVRLREEQGNFVKVVNTANSPHYRSRQTTHENHEVRHSEDKSQEKFKMKSGDNGEGDDHGNGKKHKGGH